jgi:hypothetical protein
MHSPTLFYSPSGASHASPSRSASYHHHYLASFGPTTPGVFGYILVAILLLVLAPLVLALAFLLWAGTRRSIERSP